MVNCKWDLYGGYFLWIGLTIELVIGKENSVDLITGPNFGNIFTKYHDSLGLTE